MRESRGAITVFQLVPVYAACLGASCGFVTGGPFGSNGRLAGMIIGGILGWVCSRPLLMRIFEWLDRKRNLCHKTVEELRVMLRDPNCKSPQLVLLELGIKGEKMENYFPVVLDLLVSPLMETRRRGWYTLVSVFPERAKIISDYKFVDSVETCRAKIQKILPIQK